MSVHSPSTALQRMQLLAELANSAETYIMSHQGELGENNLTYREIVRYSQQLYHHARRILSTVDGHCKSHPRPTPTTKLP